MLYLCAECDYFVTSVYKNGGQGSPNHFLHTEVADWPVRHLYFQSVKITKDPRDMYWWWVNEFILSYCDNMKPTININMSIKDKKEQIVDSIRKHEESNVSYFELGSHIFELSQKAHHIYAEKADPKQKRSLLGIVFSNLSLKDGKLVPNYQNAFQVVAKCAENNEWLPLLDAIRTFFRGGGCDRHSHRHPQFLQRY